MVPHLLSGCTSVEIKDQAWYGNKGSLGAVEFHTLSSSQKDITKSQWNAILLTQPLVCTSVETFGDVKKAVEQLCSICNCCDYNTKVEITNFFNNVNSVGD